MYNRKILKYLYKLNKSTDEHKKNIYKSKLNYYNNQIGGGRCSIENCDCEAELTQGELCTCRGHFHNEQAKSIITSASAPFKEELTNIFLEKALVDIAFSFYTSEFEFDCKKMGICISKASNDHTECFMQYITTKYTGSKIPSLVLNLPIDMKILVKPPLIDIFDELSSLKIGSSFGITRIPKELQELKLLTNLDCSDCKQLQYVIPIIQLKKLNISGTLMSILPTLVNFVNLEELDCSDMSSLRSVLPELKKLKKLKCSRTPILNIPLLENLQELDCERCDKLSSIPEIKTLTKLNCFGCENLETIPVIETLTELDCSNTMLSNEQLQKLLSNLPNLKKLKCNATITRIPLLENLEELDCSNSQLEVIPDQLTKLKKLNVSNTNIRIIPLLENLEVLYCSDTPLTFIPLLENLKVLNCSNTQLLVIPPQLTKLKKLITNISIHIPPNILKNLE